jgi:hypothetical protein
MINLGFLIEGKPCCYIHHTFLLGFPTAWLFTTHQAKFSGAVAGEEVEDFCEGSFRTHILYFVICFALLYFILLASFYQKPKKIRILDSCFYLSTFSLLKWLILKTPSCVSLLARTIVILSAPLLRHLLLLQIFMRLSLLY